MNITHRLVLSWKETWKTFLSILWWVWLPLEFSSYFWYEYKNFIFFIVSIVISIWLAFYFNWPKSYFEFKIRNKDTYIWVKIWDIFKSKGAIIVPINNNLDPEQWWHTWNKKSILSSLICKIYDWNSHHLKQDIKNEGITIGKTFDIWKTIKIEHKNRKFYLVCNTKVHESGRSVSTKDDIPPTLTFLFEYLWTCCDKEEIINIPLLNSGHWRIPDMTREMILKEIIFFFIEGLKTKDICDKLVIYIHPSDLKKSKMDIKMIVDFLKYNAESYRDINYTIWEIWSPTE